MNSIPTSCLPTLLPLISSEPDPTRATSSLTPIARVQRLLDRPRGEEWIWGQDDVGLYKGSDKLPSHQLLSVQLTTHRLLFLLIPSPTPTSKAPGSSAPQSRSSTPIPPPTNKSDVIPDLQVRLQDVRQTEFYTGFIRSSPKISLFLGRPHDNRLPAEQGSRVDTSFESHLYPSVHPSSVPSLDRPAIPRFTTPSNPSPGWTCRICSYTNPHSETVKCALCGILRATSSTLPPQSEVASQAGSGRDGVPDSGSGRGTGGRSTPDRRIASEDALAGTESDGIVTTSSGLDLTPSNACPRCTFENHPSLHECEICSAPLLPSTSTRTQPNPEPIIPNPSSNFTQPPTNANAKANSTPAQLDLIKISFRKGGSAEMYKRLKAVLERKAWESGAGEGGGERGSRGQGAGGGYGTLGRVGLDEEDGFGRVRQGIGIDRILQNIDLESKSKDEDVQDAFKDLEALMVRAGDMVRLVQSLSARLEQSPSTADEDTPETTFIRSSLVQLGLPVPALTQDMVKSEAAYHLGLAKELGTFLTGGMDDRGRRIDGVMAGKNGKGLVGLDEVWGLWNRARGISLVPPKTISAVLPLLQAETQPPIRTMTFDSGLSVLHTPAYSAQAFAARLIWRLETDDVESSEAAGEKSLTAVDIALQEGIAVGLAKELVEKIEAESGLIVRDEQSAEGGGERWQRNLISAWIWNELNNHTK